MVAASLPRTRLLRTNAAALFSHRVGPQLREGRTNADPLHNRDWHNGVNVQARRGPYLDPNQNTYLGERQLQYNADWIIDSGTDDVQYRRDADPDHPDGTMTPWTNLSSANGDQTANI
jgi:hypothetical protein